MSKNTSAQNQHFSHKKRVLLFVTISTHFKEMWRVALLLKKESPYFPIVYFDSKYEGFSADIELCKKNQIMFLTPADFNACYQKNEQDVKAVTKEKPINSVYPQIKSFFSKTFTTVCEGFVSCEAKMGGNGHESLRKFITRCPRFIRLFLIIASFLLGIMSYSLRSLKLLFLMLWEATSPTDREQKTVKFMFRMVKYPFKIFGRFILKNFELPSRLIIKFYPLTWEKYSSYAPAFTCRAKFIYHVWPNFLEKYDIALLVFPEHNLFYFTQLAAFFGRQKGIPSVIVPFTMANTREWAESFISSFQSNSNFAINKVFAKKFPHWVLKYKNKSLVFPYELILLNEMLGTTPQAPWLINSGEIGAIAVESQAMLDYYQKAGIEKKVLKFTGALYDDNLFYEKIQANHHRNKLYKELKFQDDSKPMLLVAFPPDQLSNRAKFCEFKTHEDIIQYLLRLLSTVTDQYNVILSLHPRIKAGFFDVIKKFPKIKISQLNIANLVPLSSLYIASCSATIRMAISCGIPVLNYDLYRYCYDDFESLKGVITVQDKKDFEKQFNLLTRDTHYYNEICRYQLEAQEYWGKIDGKAGERMLALFEEILNGKRSQLPSDENPEYADSHTNELRKQAC